MIRNISASYIYYIIILDFAHGVTDIQTIKHYLSDASCASFFRHKALTLFHPLDQAIIGHCVKKDRRIFSEEGNRAGF